MFNVIGAAVWSVGIVVAGILFGGISFVAAHIELITIGLAGLSVIPGAVAYWHGRRTRSDVVGQPPATTADVTS